MRDYSLVKINLTGGIASPGVLEGILLMAQKAGVKEVSIGARQQLLMWVKADTQRGSGLPSFRESLEAMGIDFEIDSEQFPNIISSYCAQEVFPTGQWLSEGIYRDILDGFDFQPKLKINISDYQQSFTPFFTGNLNFIASSIPNFWYLYIRQKQSNTIFRFPLLIYTLEISKVSKRLEQILLAENTVLEDEIFGKVMEQGDFISQKIHEDLGLPQFMLPYYEGFNRYGNKTWLGIYRRHETFEVAFLLDVCKICLDTKVGQICTTPWKSLIIKGIENHDRILWDKLLGRFGINVRHAANELNWQVEDTCPEGLALKNTIIREFDQEDIRTFGLCFAVQTRSKSEVFGSVVVKKRKILLGLSQVYDVYHTVDFNPNTRQLVLFEKGLHKAHIAEILQRLTKRYYHRSTASVIETPSLPQTTPTSTHQVYQCHVCMTIYDEKLGDSQQGIKAGTKFEALPDNYCCPVCDSEKENFEVKTVETMYQL
ncbi:MAG: rubredoxin [Flectobacillus sp.]|uniref:rubredoxin n=1 Tax=Flectobacillus sp. TaxID=50419 RepID=UPI003B9C62DD